MYLVGPRCRALLALQCSIFLKQKYSVSVKQNQLGIVTKKGLFGEKERAAIGQLQTR